MILDENGLNSLIDENIYENENNEITPTMLRLVLKALTGSAQLRQIAGPSASISVNVPVFEFTSAATVQVVQTWSAAAGGRPLLSIVLNNQAVSLGAARTSTLTLPANATTTLSVVASDGVSSTTATATVTFALKRYLFASQLDLISEPSQRVLAQTALQETSGEVATSRAKASSFTLDNEFLYYVLPASYGNPTLKINGFANSDVRYRPFTMKNASGFDYPAILVQTAKGNSTYLFEFN